MSVHFNWQRPLRVGTIVSSRKVGDVIERKILGCRIGPLVIMVWSRFGK